MANINLKPPCPLPVIEPLLMWLRANLVDCDKGAGDKNNTAARSFTRASALGFFTHAAHRVESLSRHNGKLGHAFRAREKFDARYAIISILNVMTLAPRCVVINKKSQQHFTPGELIRDARVRLSAEAWR